MIRGRLIALRERRALLVARAQSERQLLGGYVERADSALQWVQRGRAWFAELGSRPLLVAGGLAALLLLRPRRVLKLLTGSLWLWRLYREAKPLVSAALAALGARPGRAT